MKAKIRIFAVLSCVGLSLSITGCITKHVTVSCEPSAPSLDNKTIQNLGDTGTIGVGFINVKGDSLGAVYQLSLTPDQVVWANPEAGIIYDSKDPTQFIQGVPADQSLTVAISWNFDASVGDKIDTSQQATLSASAPKSWTYSMKNAYQTQIQGTLARINSDSGNSKLKADILANPKDTFLVMNPVLSGDTATLTVDDSKDVTAQDNIGIGFMVKADVKYNCSSDIVRNKVAAAQPVVIAYAELVTASADGQTVVHAKGLNFPAPSHAITIDVSTQPQPTQPKSKVKSYTVIHFCKAVGNPKDAVGCKNQQ